MSSKVQPISAMEDTVPTPITTTTVTPKVSIFAKKSGFLIPKNKLSGSLVPIFRGSKKPGGVVDVEDKERTNKQALRKTKWGPDLTQDAFVRKGRASAYQTRLDQITQLLKLGVMEARDDHQESPDYHNIQKSELEFERREVIGEILKLNPSYKTPPDYKPLLKEDKVAIPIKEYPGRNFIGLIFGPAGDTQKRLEKETGAKIRVYGIKAETKKVIEITTSDGNETHGDYEELYVLVTAETFEKVDAAASLIELLVTPVLGNNVAVFTNDPVSENNPNVVSLSQDATVLLNPGSGLAPPVARFQPYPNHWVPTSQSSGFIAPPFPNLSVPMQVSGPPDSVQQIQQHPHMVQMPNMGYVDPPRNPSLPPLQPKFSTQPFTPTRPNQNMLPMGSPMPRSGPNMPQTMQPTLRPQTPPFRPSASISPVAPPPPPPNSGPTSWFTSPSTRPPPLTALRPQRPTSNDFTFQTQTPTGSQFMPPHNPPQFRPGMNNQGFLRPQSSQMPPPPDRQLVFHGHGSRPIHNPHVGPTRQFGPGQGQGQGSPGGPFPPRPGNFGPVRQNHPSTGFRPPNLMGPPSQQFRGNVSMGRPGVFSTSGPPQVYDPFSPSVVPRKPQGNPQSSRKQDSDPEYDDLMASVGLK